MAISGDESENCVDGGTGVNDCGVRHPTVIAATASRDVSGIIFLAQFAAEPFLNLKILPPALILKLNELRRPRVTNFAVRGIARLEGFEPTTPGSEDRCSSPLSYRRKS